MYTIGQLARRAKVNADSIRFYERQGLLAPAGKTPAGYRLYTDGALRCLAFIKHAQRCGFSLADIADLLHMHKADERRRRDAYRVATRKQTEIQKTMNSLQAMSVALARVIAPSATELESSSAADPMESPLLAALEASLAQSSPGGTVRSPSTIGQPTL